MCCILLLDKEGSDICNQAKPILIFVDDIFNKKTILLVLICYILLLEKDGSDIFNQNQSGI